MLTLVLKTIKPFLTNKGHKAGNSLMIMNDNKLVNNPIEVAEIMNSFYIRDGPFDIQGGLGFFLATSYFFLSFSTTSYFFQK